MERGQDEEGGGERPPEAEARGDMAGSASFYALTGAESVLKGIDQVLADRILVRFDNPEDEEMYHRTIAAVRILLDAAGETFRDKLGPKEE
jgi:hypothetical protein